MSEFQEASHDGQALPADITRQVGAAFIRMYGQDSEPTVSNRTATLQEFQTELTESIVPSSQDDDAFAEFARLARRADDLDIGPKALAGAGLPIISTEVALSIIDNPTAETILTGGGIIATVGLGCLALYRIGRRYAARAEALRQAPALQSEWGRASKTNVLTRSL